MWGEIKNKKILSIDENYCFGEPTLELHYNNAKRVIVFKDRKNLKQCKTMLNLLDNVKVNINNNIIIITYIDANVSVNIYTINKTHAERLFDVLENIYNNSSQKE